MAKLKNNPDYTRVRLGTITTDVDEAIEKHIFTQSGGCSIQLSHKDKLLIFYNIYSCGTPIMLASKIWRSSLCKSTV
jgi:hypothetical protein